MGHSLSPRANIVVHLADIEAERLDHGEPTGAHLILAMLTEGEGVPNALLRECGVATDRLRDDLLDVLGVAGEARAAYLRQRQATYVLPLVVGFRVGRYWAPALILVLLFCGGISADILEPLQRRELPEGETAAALAAMVIALFHAPLLVVGAWMRKRLWPRAPAKKWSLT